MERCPWCGSDPLYVAYHDEEWGRPIHDERRHFEFLLLETQQAGLSWRCVLGKREAYRRAFAGFDPEKVARFGPARIERLLADPGLIRNRRKLEAAARNARAFLATAEEFGSFDAYIWRFVEGRPLVNAWRSPAEVPVTTESSDALSKDLKSRGFGFVGSTTMYAHMQAIGMVNDHLASCFRWAELGGGRGRKER
ncbi:MAG TPA: DNA-3-methyladenine glycosylase I [Spirochaetales bacterium]|nr:DNA-3-methyladenine glycosylase I [Spirochaetales bacterium]HRY55433.1 DNA-3-methyladenine glycosylase I [Spirochaetia bacterium]HRZ65847.1 DNA-3-methyladenine glycosylase I [Spirochaetia bacterium]